MISKSISVLLKIISIFCVYLYFATYPFKIRTLHPQIDINVISLITHTRTHTNVYFNINKKNYKIQIDIFIRTLTYISILMVRSQVLFHFGSQIFLAIFSFYYLKLFIFKFILQYWVY
jgi:hypothetical protein